MSIFQCNFYSKILRTMTKVIVVLPTAGSKETAEKSLETLYEKTTFPVLYLLHGMNQDETTWLRKSNVERYAQEKGIALVMPNGENNYYTNMAHGLPYFTYLTEELPRFIQFTFPITNDRNKTYIGGLSMGGYGACKAAMSKPEQYCAFVCLSGALDIEKMLTEAEMQGFGYLIDTILGDMDEFSTSDANLFYLAEKLKASGKTMPHAYVANGTEDVECYEMNLKFKECLEKLLIPITYVECAGGHNWDFWDEQIKNVLEWLDSV